MFLRMSSGWNEFMVCLLNFIPIDPDLRKFHSAIMAEVIEQLTLTWQGDESLGHLKASD